MKQKGKIMNPPKRNSFIYSQIMARVGFEPTTKGL